MPGNTMLGKDTCAERLSFHSLEDTWKIELEVSRNKVTKGLWDIWLTDCDIYEGPTPTIRAGFSGEQAVWGGSRDLYYEVRFPVVEERGYIYMLMCTLHIPNFSTKDIRSIKEHPVMQQVLNSLRLEES